MGWWFRGRAADPVGEGLDTLIDSLSRGPGPGPAVLVIAPHLDRRVDRARCLALAAIAGLTVERAARLGGEVAALRAALDGGSAEARFVRAVAALVKARRGSLVDPPLWSAAARRRLFDPGALVRLCAYDRTLAALADRVWTDAAARMRDLGDDPAARALECWGMRRAGDTIRCGRLPFTRRAPCV